MQPRPEEKKIATTDRDISQRLSYKESTAKAAPQAATALLFLRLNALYLPEKKEQELEAVVKTEEQKLKTLETPAVEQKELSEAIQQQKDRIQLAKTEYEKHQKEIAALCKATYKEIRDHLAKEEKELQVEHEKLQALEAQATEKKELQEKVQQAQDLFLLAKTQYESRKAAIEHVIKSAENAPGEFADVTIRVSPNTVKTYSFPFDRVLTVTWKALCDDAKYTHHFSGSPEEKLDMAHKDRVHRFKSFMTASVQLHREKSCNMGKRNTYGGLLSQSYEDVVLIEDDEALELCFLKDEVFKLFSKHYHAKDTSAEHKKSLRAGLFDWMESNDTNPLLEAVNAILNQPRLPDLKKSSHNVKETLFKSINDLFAGYGLSYGYGKSGGAQVYFGNRLHAVEFSCDLKENQLMGMVHSILSAREMPDQPERNAAFKTMQQWIHEHYDPETPLTSRLTIANFHVMLNTQQLLIKHDALLEMTGRKDKFKPLAEQVTAYFKACAENTYEKKSEKAERVLFPVLKTETLVLAQQLPQAVSQCQKDTLMDKINDFFALWFLAIRDGDIESQRRLYTRLLDPVIQARIKIEDSKLAELLPPISQEEAKTGGIRDITSYVINRFFLHAIITRPQEWSTEFLGGQPEQKQPNGRPMQLGLKEVFAFVKSNLNGEQKSIKATLKGTSYPDTLLNQIEYLIKVKERQLVEEREREAFEQQAAERKELARQPEIPRPAGMIVLPQQMQTEWDISCVANMLGTTPKDLYEGYAVQIHRACIERMDCTANPITKWNIFAEYRHLFAGSPEKIKSLLRQMGNERLRSLFCYSGITTVLMWFKPENRLEILSRDQLLLIIQNPEDLASALICFPEEKPAAIFLNQIGEDELQKILSNHTKLKNFVTKFQLVAEEKEIAAILGQVFHKLGEKYCRRLILDLTTLNELLNHNKNPDLLLDVLTRHNCLPSTQEYKRDDILKALPKIAWGKFFASLKPQELKRFIPNYEDLSAILRALIKDRKYDHHTLFTNFIDKFSPDQLRAILPDWNNLKDALDEVEEPFNTLKSKIITQLGAQHVCKLIAHKGHFVTIFKAIAGTEVENRFWDQFNSGQLLNIIMRSSGERRSITELPNASLKKLFDKLSDQDLSTALGNAEELTKILHRMNSTQQGILLSRLDATKNIDPFVIQTIIRNWDQLETILNVCDPSQHKNLLSLFLPIDLRIIFSMDKRAVDYKAATSKILGSHFNNTTKEVLLNKLTAVYKQCCTNPNGYQLYSGYGPLFGYSMGQKFDGATRLLIDMEADRPTQANAECSTGRLGDLVAAHNTLQKQKGHLLNYPPSCLYLYYQYLANMIGYAIHSSFTTVTGFFRPNPRPVRYNEPLSTWQTVKRIALGIDSRTRES